MSGRDANWPLTGVRVLVTRSKERSSTLVEALRAERAVPVELPAISVTAVSSDALDAALEALSGAAWIVVTSAAGVDVVAAHALQRGRASVLSACRFAAVGPATADALRQAGYPAAFVPLSATGMALGRQLPGVHGRKVVLLQAEAARDDLKSELLARGAQVQACVVYTTRRTALQAEDWIPVLEDGFDCVTFTSGSTVENLLGSFEVANRSQTATMLRRAVIACIGPTTAERARQRGLDPHVIASEHTIQGLVDALRDFYRSRETPP